MSSNKQVTPELLGDVLRASDNLAEVLEFPQLILPGEERFTTEIVQEEDNVGGHIYEVSGRVQVNNDWTSFTAYFPENRVEPGFGLLFPGFCGFIKSSEGLGKAAAKQGLANVIFDPMRLSSSIWKDLTDPQEVHVKTGEAVMKQLRGNRRVNRDMPEGRAAVRELLVVASHSMGGLSAPRFVEEHADDVEILGLYQTVGRNKSIGGTLLKALFNGDLIGSGKHELVPYLTSDDIEINKENLLRLVRYFGLPKLGRRDARVTQPIGEMISCLRTDMGPILKRIGETPVKRLFIGAKHDILIQPKDDIADHVDRVVTVLNAGHLLEQCKSALAAKTLLDNRREMAEAA